MMPMRPVTTRLPPHLVTAVTREAARRGLRRTQFIREAIEVYAAALKLC
jgi:predicted DNA binding CopG/RHH family protein